MKKYIAYLRVSTQAQKESALSLESQEERIRAYIKYQGGELVAVFKDCYSGAKAERPGLNALLKSARMKEFDTVVVISLDRLGRNTRDNFNLIKALSDLDINLISLRENVDFSTPVGTVVFATLSSLAELELAIIRERNIASKGRYLERGLLNIFNPRFPMMFSSDKKSLLLDPKKEPAWELMKELRFEQQLSYAKIAKELNRLPPEKRGDIIKKGKIIKEKKWSAVTVKECIDNRDLVNGFVALSFTNLEGKEIRKQVLCEKLLTAEQYEISQEISRRNITYNPGKSRESHLLSKMLKCGDCGSPMWMHESRGKKYFRCSKKCGLPYLALEEADEIIKLELAMAQRDYRVIEKAIKLANADEGEISLEDLAEREKELNAQEREWKNKEKNIITQIEDGFLKGIQVKKRMNEIELNLNDINQQRSDIEVKRSIVAKTSAKKEEIKQAWIRIMKGWGEATPTEQRRILKILFPSPYSIIASCESEGWSFTLLGIIDSKGITSQYGGYHTYYGIGL